MRRHAIIGALLMIGLGVILGATVFRTDIAQATGLAQSVTVSNTPAQAVPVREQNLDNGNVKVHEQGTVSVRSADKEVSVTAVGFADLTDTCGGDLYTVPAGKQLVIKYISGFGNAITGSPPTNASGIIYTGDTPTNDMLTVVFQEQAHHTFSTSESVNYVVPPGSEIHFLGVLEGASHCGFTFALGGVLQPVP
jgi:hypothetical protein